MTSSSYVAVDLGAESGRVILGVLKNKKLQIEEVYRFPNGCIQLGESLYWDVLRIWSEIKTGLSNAVTQTGGELRSIGLDAWGVDFGLLDANDNLIGNPFHYRDARTRGVLDTMFERVQRSVVYEQTGIQFMEINSLCQLYALAQAEDPSLSIAETFLNIPDLLNFFLTGVKASEFTIATTSQCYNPTQRAWAADMLKSLGIPSKIFGEIVEPGTILGPLSGSLAEELGLPTTAVIASAGHDTASAVAAVPASTEDYLYLSSGTWSLMGVELDEPLISAESLAANMTNEGGVGGKFRFLKNIVGLWLVQECRRTWSQLGQNYDYSSLTDLASNTPGFGPLVLLSDHRFLTSKDMPATLLTYCQETGQASPNSKGEIIRCILESLALEYRWVAEQIIQLTGKSCSTIHIVGGGTKNKLLNQFTANATGKIVITGPVEATAIGNLLVQAIAMGEIDSLTEGREIVRNSFEVETYVPHDTEAWHEAYQRYTILKKNDE
jgi:rhamnulokinase